MKGFFNVRDFNAVGDGITDDTKAIQECINEAQKNRGTAYFPPGVYLITSTIYLGNPDGGHDYPFSIQGEGKGNSQSIIKTKSNMNMVESIGSCQVAIRELSFRHEGNKGIILYLEQGMGHIISDCSFANVVGNKDDMLLFACSYVDIVNSKFGNNEPECYAIRCTNIGKKININSNIFDSRIYGKGKGLIVDTNEPTNRPEGLKVSRNMFLNTGTEQITVRTILHIDISNNMMDQASGTSILLDPADYSVCGAFILGNYISPAKDRENGVCILAVDNGRKMNGVNITDNMLAYTGQGVVLGKNCQFFNISNNMFSEIKKQAVMINGAESSNVVNNTFWNCETSLHAIAPETSSLIVSNNQFFGKTVIESSREDGVLLSNNAIRNDKILPF